MFGKRRKIFSRCAKGKRRDLGQTFWRSSWEANYARYLKLLKRRGDIDKWEYEPERFIFHGETRGPVAYLPDFRLTYPDGSVVYHEVKGWMDSGSKSRLKKMQKFYPDIRVEVVGSKEYRALEKELGQQITHWEFKPYRPRARKTAGSATAESTTAKSATAAHISESYPEQ